jgi:Alg9-like mannosyltransferase family
VKTLSVVLDAAICLATAVALDISLTRGFAFTVGHSAIRVDNAGNAIVIISVLVALRYLTRKSVPFIGLRSLPLSRFGSTAADWLSRCRRDSSVLAKKYGTRLVAVVILSAALIKITNAVSHPGFFSGDDVEIHEMTLGHAFGTNWPVWSLRSAFYPMVFIYPAQAALLGMGISNIETLVLAGRLVVVTLTSLGLVLMYVVARRPYGRSTAILAVTILATSGLHIVFGGMELPRSVSAFFVMAAFFLLADRRHMGRPVMAGIVLAIATCMRFSEVAFFLPALIQLFVERRWSNAVVLAGAGLAATLVIQVSSDILYWGQAFHSAREIVTFTLIDRLSSRGYDSAWYYLTHLTSWTDLLVLGLAVAAMNRRHWRLSLWLCLPVLELSLLPHKEPRYLIPVLPILSLLAALGMRSVVFAIANAVESTKREALATLLALAIPLRLIDVTAGYHIRPSDSQVRLAKELGGRSGGGIALEQVWRFGGHLYLPSTTAILDVGPDTFQGSSEFQNLVADGSVRMAAISDRTCERTSCEEMFRGAGFEEVETEASRRAGYRVFGR